MKIPVFSSTIRRREMDAVLTCMVSEKIGPGEMNIKFMQLVKEIFKVDGALILRSTSIALLYALEALAIEPRTGVIVSALAPAWQYHSIKKSGYIPIIADVHPDTALMTPETISEAVQRGGRVIIFHETAGSLPGFDEIRALNIPLIEDISHSAGSVIGEKMAGTFGVFSILGLEENDILTSGGGAVLIAPNKRESIILNKIGEQAPSTDILPDINSALAYVQLKELNRNSQLRQEIKTLFLRSLLQGRHKTFPQPEDVTSSVYSFPVILSSGFKDVKSYTNRKEVEIELAFSGSIAAYLGDQLEGCMQAKSLLMRCVFFPLYPRLGSANAAKISKLLATLP
ncbi:MAG TPA: DegT/DnrJ/EryC1/StrS family aminotransferase [Treponemataceae bacterium]|nr:DegT/DnrJ/EryC1/StrS family aminotransferase [Treponemataceae bacterium]